MHNILQFLLNFIKNKMDKIKLINAFYGILMLNFLSGACYNANKIEELKDKAFAKADINQNQQLEIDEVLDAYVEFGDDNEKLIERLGYKETKQYLMISNKNQKNVTYTFFNKFHYDDKEHIEIINKIADIDNNGLNLEEISRVYNLAYGNSQIEELNFSSGKDSKNYFDFMKSVARLSLVPFIYNDLCKNSELGKYVRGEY